MDAWPFDGGDSTSGSQQQQQRHSATVPMITPSLTPQPTLQSATKFVPKEQTHDPPPIVVKIHSSLVAKRYASEALQKAGYVEFSQAPNLQISVNNEPVPPTSVKQVATAWPFLFSPASACHTVRDLTSMVSRALGTPPTSKYGRQPLKVIEWVSITSSNGLEIAQFLNLQQVLTAMSPEIRLIGVYDDEVKFLQSVPSGTESQAAADAKKKTAGTGKGVNHSDKKRQMLTTPDKSASKSNAKKQKTDDNQAPAKTAGSLPVIPEIKAAGNIESNTKPQNNVADKNSSSSSTERKENSKGNSKRSNESKAKADPTVAAQPQGNEVPLKNNGPTLLQEITQKDVNTHGDDVEKPKDDRIGAEIDKAAPSDRKKTERKMKKNKKTTAGADPEPKLSTETSNETSMSGETPTSRTDAAAGKDAAKSDSDPKSQSDVTASQEQQKGALTESEESADAARKEMYRIRGLKSAATRKRNADAEAEEEKKRKAAEVEEEERQKKIEEDAIEEKKRKAAEAAAKRKKKAEAKAKADADAKIIGDEQEKFKGDADEKAKGETTENAKGETAENAKMAVKAKPKEKDDEAVEKKRQVDLEKEKKRKEMEAEAESRRKAREAAEVEAKRKLKEAEEKRKEAETAAEEKRKAEESAEVERKRRIAESSVPKRKTNANDSDDSSSEDSDSDEEEPPQKQMPNASDSKMSDSDDSDDSDDSSDSDDDNDQHKSKAQKPALGHGGNPARSAGAAMNQSTDSNNNNAAKTSKEKITKAAPGSLESYPSMREMMQQRS